MEGEHNSIFMPNIWQDKLDKSSTFYNVVQVTPDNTSLANVSSTGGGPVRFNLQKSSTYILLAHNDTCVRFKVRYGYLQNGKPYRFADTAPESDLGSMLIAKASLKIGGRSVTEYTSGCFNIQHEIENNMEPLEYRLKSGEEQGFIPDVNSGMAESISCAYLTLVPTANIANGASGLFGVLVTNNTSANYAATAANVNAPLYWNIPGTNLTLPVIVPAGGIASGSSGVCAIAAPFGITANTPASWAFGCTSLMLNSTATVAASTAAAPTSCYIFAYNTTGAQINTYTAEFQLTAPTTNAQLSSLQYPLNVGNNINYEPGYVRRKMYYGYIPNSAINNSNVVANPLLDTNWRYIDIKFPLNRLSRFCKHYQSVLANVDIELAMFMSNYVAAIPNPNIVPFNAAPPNNAVATGCMNAVFGMPNAQMVIQVTSVQLDYVTYTPSPQSIISLNNIFASKFDVDYIDCVCGVFPSQYSIGAKSAISQMQLDVKKRMCYLIIVFKNANISATSQNYGGFVNANINSVSITYGKGGNMVFPANPQNDDFTVMGNTTFCSGPKHFYAQYRNLFQRWHATKEIPMSESEFRNLYTMYCFDLTDLNEIDKDSDSAIYVTINRTATPGESATTFENYYALYYMRKATFDYSNIGTPLITLDQ